MLPAHPTKKVKTESAAFMEQSSVKLYHKEMQRTLNAPSTHKKLSHSHRLNIIAQQQQQFSNRLQAYKQQLEARTRTSHQFKLIKDLYRQYDDKIREYMHLGSQEQEFLENILFYAEYNRMVMSESHVGSGINSQMAESKLNQRMSCLREKIQRVEMAMSRRMNQEVQEEMAWQRARAEEGSRKVGELEGQLEWVRKEAKRKVFLVEIIKEQIKSLHKQVVRGSYCVIRNGGQGEVQMRYLKFNKKNTGLQILQNESLEAENENQFNWWSQSKGKSGNTLKQLKALQWSKFTSIVMHPDDIGLNLRVFVVSCLYKSIDKFHRMLSNNSQEYQVLFDFHADPHLEQQLRQVNDSLDNGHHNNTILLISRKSQGLLAALVELIRSTVAGLQNKVVTVTSLAVKEEPLVLFKDTPQRSRLVCVELELNASYKKTITLLDLVIKDVDNPDIFGRQLRMMISREKGLKDHISPQLESLLKSTDKYLFITELNLILTKKKQLDDSKKLIEFYRQFDCLL